MARRSLVAVFLDIEQIVPELQPSLSLAIFTRRPPTATELAHRMEQKEQCENNKYDRNQYGGREPILKAHKDSRDHYQNPGSHEYGRTNL